MKSKVKKIGRPKGKIPMKKLTLSVPEEAWMMWAIQAKMERTTMSELAVRLLTQYVSGMERR